MAWKHRLISTDLARMEGVCAHCGPVKLKRRSGNAAGKPRTVCCATAKREERMPDGVSSFLTERRGGHGLTSEEAQEFLRGKVCWICGHDGSEVRLEVDHCHATGEKRDALCLNCNTGLGRFKDDPELLARAIKYLASHASR